MKNIFKPILFSTPMVKAILSGRKTQTRREIKKRYSNTDLVFKTDKYGTRLIERQNDVPPPVDNGNGKITHRLTTYAEVKPKYQVGDILWVRETFDKLVTDDSFVYAADVFDPKTDKPYFGWKPSIHMPKAAARIFLYVTNVRVERLQDISEADAIAEGVKLDPNFGYWCYECDKDGHIGHTPICEDGFFKTAKEAFRSLWISINGLKSWNENPYVWIYDFEVIEKPKDFI